ncbi:MAG: divalent-cation tolerance protein CutA [Candidatus Omnitrophota bacterium]
MYSTIFVTCSSAKEAKLLARTLLEERLIACANIVPTIDSHYRWKGTIESAKESLLILKTKRSLFRKVERVILRNHSYETPEIIALPIVAGSRGYLSWIEDSCAQKKRKK